MVHPRPWVTGREGKGTGLNRVPQNSHPTAVTRPCTPLPVQRCPFCKVCLGLSSTDMELGHRCKPDRNYPVPPGHRLLPIPPPHGMSSCCSAKQQTAGSGGCLWRTHVRKDGKPSMHPLLEPLLSAPRVLALIIKVFSIIREADLVFLQASSF